MNGDLRIFAGTANRHLAETIASKLDIKLERTDIARFSDGEIRVEIRDNVRGVDAVIIQSTCAPTNDNVMELILLADALRRSSVRSITAVIPYFGYSRQDRRPGYSRVPISARVVANMIEGVGIDHVVTLDIHASQIQGFFQIPVDNIAATQLFVADIYGRYMDQNPIIVSPDVGGVARARQVAKLLDNTDLAIVDKRRQRANESEVMNIIGDIEDRTCIMIDDMVDTAGTMCKAADALMLRGARQVVCYASHGILSGDAFTNIKNSMLYELVITNTIPVDFVSVFRANSKIRQISCAGILAETISRIHNGQSISEILE
jgi:ribose-phosphate pyrophosphokinase